jgi:hypothetical protein
MKKSMAVFIFLAVISVFSFSSCTTPNFGSWYNEEKINFLDREICNLSSKEMASDDQVFKAACRKKIEFYQAEYDSLISRFLHSKNPDELSERELQFRLRGVELRRQELALQKSGGNKNSGLKVIVANDFYLPVQFIIEGPEKMSLLLDRRSRKDINLLPGEYEVKFLVNNSERASKKFVVGANTHIFKGDECAALCFF